MRIVDELLLLKRVDVVLYTYTLLSESDEIQSVDSIAPARLTTCRMFKSPYEGPNSVRPTPIRSPP